MRARTSNSLQGVSKTDWSGRTLERIRLTCASARSSSSNEGVSSTTVPAYQRYPSEVSLTLGPVQQTYADRAVATYNAMQQSMYVSDRSSLYQETSPPSGNRYAYLWPFSRAL